MGMSTLFQNKNIRIKLLFCIFIFICTVGSFAQTNDSNRLVTLQMRETSLRKVFQSITSQTGFRFAYNPTVLDEKATVSINVFNERLDTVLLFILPDSVKYKLINDYIILSSKIDKEEEKKDSIFPISDVVLNDSEKDTIIFKDTVRVHHYYNNDTILNALEEIKQQLSDLKGEKQAKLRDTNKGNWIISISSGVKSEICFATSYSRKFWNDQHISIGPIELGFGYLFSNHIQIETGIKYSKNYVNYSFEAFNWGGDIVLKERKSLYPSVDIPLCIKYYLPLGKSNWSFLIKAAIDFNVPLMGKRSEVYEAEDIPTDIFPWESPSTGEQVQALQRLYYSTIVEAPLRKMNILLNLGAGFSYQFKFGLGFSVYGEYYAGTMNMTRVAIPYRQEQFNNISNSWEFYNEGTEYVTSRGDYWNVALAISYKFKNRKQ
jgi:hypothetical protein